MNTLPGVLLGCAGWALAREHQADFVSEGTHLQRYAARLCAVEVNSCFYRPHRPQTWARWGESVPPGFRFSVKLPQTITHVQRLVDCEPLLDRFLGECTQLGERLGCILIQLPPSLNHDPVQVARFFDAFRQRFSGSLVIEPRHASWAAAQAQLIDYQVAQVAADPSRLSTDTLPSGWPHVHYWRLHGSPNIYYSPYGRERLLRLASALRRSASAGIETWCIFDNTAAGAAVHDALSLQAMLEGAADLQTD